MLKRLNITLLVIAIVFGLICVGFTIYYDQVDVMQSNVIKTIESTVNPTGGM